MDKNGVMVTRHVRSSVKPFSGALSIPAPKIIAQPKVVVESVQEQLEEARVLLDQQLAKITDCYERFESAVVESDELTKHYKASVNGYRSMMLSEDRTEEGLSKAYALVEVASKKYRNAKSVRDALLVEVKSVEAETKEVTRKYRELVLEEAMVVDEITGSLLEGAL
jgi:type I restriction-modification system DNA methylase subunit